ncbi:hypothetical protein [Levilactobacillus zymae]|uniref:DUF2628 domain-containing protein n=1 Tax=Levilactobacillus zymae TaxID=267363 RepID=A0A1Y6JVW6_9LACO|nr:hypothetical protein [Levilactobacillus zymae]QFR61661.1 hypothetical protein LZ395_09060 [Levilactobacillus zymae]GEO72892.1 hypothetical protein LZY01_20600 [Levilactobacillus zymae]SMS13271.1 hypothetical protein LZ3411_0221 [Levilactobacillus zymae]
MQTKGRVNREHYSRWFRFLDWWERPVSWLFLISLVVMVFANVRWLASVVTVSFGFNLVWLISLVVEDRIHKRRGDFRYY